MRVPATTSSSRRSPVMDHEPSITPALNHRRLRAKRWVITSAICFGLAFPADQASAQEAQVKASGSASPVATESMDAELDPTAIAQQTLLKIIDEGKNRNQTMVHLRHLCEEIGPRLTGSTRLDQACHWAADQFRSFGLQNISLKQWGEIPVRFDRGECKGRMVEPIAKDFEFTAKAWSAGTDGPRKGPVLREPQSPEELEALTGRLEGAWILRPAGAKPSIVVDRLNHAGIAGFVTTATAEIVNTGGVRGITQMKLEDISPIPTVTIRRSDYDAINSRIMDGEKVVLEFDLKHNLKAGPFPVYNTIAEIPGSTKPEEVVIISAHLDSWDGPGSQGTVDNGTGSAVTIEAARILAAVGAKPKRTIRFILWSGEEQGLLGSKAYVQQLSEEEKSRISAVFVDDSGTNQQASLTCVEPMAPMLKEAILPMNFAFPHAPLKLNVAPRMPRGGASDHSPFNAVGIPGFFWGKSGTAVYRYAWHTQNDRMDQAIPEYLTKNSTVSAIAAFVLADAETLLPRAPIPTEETASPQQAPSDRPPQLEDPSNVGAK